MESERFNIFCQWLAWAIPQTLAIPFVIQCYTFRAFVPLERRFRDRQSDFTSGCVIYRISISQERGSSSRAQTFPFINDYDIHSSAFSGRAILIHWQWQSDIHSLATQWQSDIHSLAEQIQQSSMHLSFVKADLAIKHKIFSLWQQQSVPWWPIHLTNIMQVCVNDFSSSNDH